MEKAYETWRNITYEQIRNGKGITVFAETILPHASLWNGIKNAVTELREFNLKRGEVIILQKEPSPEFLYYFFACIRENLPLAIVQPGENAAIDNIRPSLIIENDKIIQARKNSGNHSNTERLNMFRNIMLILGTSGTTGDRKFIALSHKSVLSVIESHKPFLNLKGARVLSVLPWQHAFGLILDLLPALFYASEVIRDPAAGKNTTGILSMLDTFQITHLSAVPVIYERLLAKTEDESKIRSLHGIIGGAPVRNHLARKLKDSNLRIGYGQTEASPGITLGAKGDFEENYLGKALGCNVKIINDQIHFSGPNVFFGYIKNGKISLARDIQMPPVATVNKSLQGEYPWIATGDLAEEQEGRIYFSGRIDDNFKLQDGRMFHAAAEEQKIKDQIHHIFLNQQQDLQNKESCFITFIEKEGQPCLLISLDPARTAYSFIASFLEKVTRQWLYIPPENWVFSEKGTVDRNHMKEIASRFYIEPSEKQAQNQKFSVENELGN